MPTVDYAVDYSVMQVKRMIRRSESRKHPINQADFGHAHSRHQAMSDADLVARSQNMPGANPEASAFLNSTRMRIPGFGAFDDAGDLVSTDYWVRMPINDQAFIVANILNSHYGRSALEKLDTPLPSRLTLSAVPFTASMTQPTTMAQSLMNFRMRVSAGGGNVSADELIGRLVIVLEAGGTHDGDPELHFVTAYPIRNALHPRFGMNPGVERKVSYGGNLSTTAAAFQWDSLNQNDPDGALIRLP
jgi:hypothetical protein